LGIGQSAREVTVASSRILVTNFDNSTTKEELKELFSVHGRVRQVEIGGVRGLGFVEMFKKSEAKKAVFHGFFCDTPWRTKNHPPTHKT
jgi:RNA recognition motif-containing protein